MPALIPYVVLLIGILAYVAGAGMWDFGLHMLEDVNLDTSSDNLIKWGMIAVAGAFVVIALSVWRILVQWFDLINYYFN